MKRKPTSEILDFAFDLDTSLARRDTNNTSIRIDFSNAKGYWDKLVDSPGIQSRDLGKLGERYFAPKNDDWRDVYGVTGNFDWDSDVAWNIEEDISAPIFWETIDSCPIGDDLYGEGVAAYVTGNIDAQFWFGFSIVVSSTFTFSSPTPVSSITERYRRS